VIKEEREMREDEPYLLTHIKVIGNFTDPGPTFSKYSGWRDVTIPRGIAARLKRHYKVSIFDTGTLPYHDAGISKVLKKDSTPNLFIIQSQPRFQMDIPSPENLTIFYVHIDGDISIRPRYSTVGFRIDNQPGRNYAKIARKQYTIPPWADFHQFNPTLEKEIFLTENISREIPFSEYREILQRSKFVIINGRMYISKRIPESIASGAIPIVISKMPEIQSLYSEHYIPCTASIEEARKITETLSIDFPSLYKWFYEHYSLDNIFKTQILPILKKYCFYTKYRKNRNPLNL